MSGTGRPGTSGSIARAEGGAERRSLPDAFQQAAMRWPGSVAVSDGDQQLTYRQLADRAAQLATALMDAGIDRGDRVGICLDRTVEYIVAILAVLSTGAAYIPLDPTHPRQRISLLLQNGGAKVVVTSAEHELLIAEAGIRVVVTDGITGTADTDRVAAATARIEPSDPVYVIYTSGSTGVPKGVAVTHHNILRLFDVTRPEYSIDHTDVWTVFHSFSFDFSVWETWGPLLHGGKLVIVPAATTRSPAVFRRLLAAEKVTIMTNTPTAFREFERAEREALHDGAGSLALRHIVIGAEPIACDDLLRWYELHPEDSPQLSNMYGPTETTVVATFGWMDRALAQRYAGLSATPIGRPLADLEVFVVGDDGDVVANGTPGEMYIGGEGVSLGYLDQPELTATRFVTHTRMAPGRRLYRTGDIGRWTPDGWLECLGRVDEQVQVRGYRVEPGEIEAVLRSYPGIGAAAVVAVGESPHMQLAAFITGLDNPDEAELRRYLRKSLPQYMIPSSFRYIAELPVSPTGKLDRRVLSGLVRTERQDTPDETGHMSGTEGALTAVWRQVLGRNDITRDDDFFELGGDSIQAMQIANLAGKAGFSIQPEDIFEHSTVAELAASVPVRVISEAATTGALTARVEADGQRAAPPSYPQMNLLIAEQLWPGTTLNPRFCNVTVSLLNGPLSLERLQFAVDAVISRHDTLRTIWRIVAGRPEAECRAVAQSPIILHDVGPLTADQLARLIYDVGASPFDMDHGPFLRCTVIRLGDDEHIVIFALQHFASDGSSVGVLYREIAAHYAQVGDAPALPALQIQYADYARWQASSFGRSRPVGDPGADEAEAEWRQYWADKLAGVQPLQLHGTATPGPGDRAQTIRATTLELDRPTAAALEQLAKENSATVFIVALTAFKIVAAARSGSSDVTLYSLRANRQPSATESLIGLFVEPMILRTDLTGCVRFSDALVRVRGTALDAQSHSDRPLLRLLEEFPKVAGALATESTTIFQYQPPREQLRLPGVTSEELDYFQVCERLDVDFYRPADLVVSLGKSGRRYMLTGEYPQDMWLHEEVRALLSDTVDVLVRAATHPDSAIRWPGITS
jgi:amino acid adenylation domain-containing protein